MTQSDKIITSATNERIKTIRSLNIKKYRDQTGLFMVEGSRHVGEALQNGWQLETLLYSEESRADPVITRARIICRDILQVTADILSKVTERDNAQPIVGIFKQQTHPLKMISQGLWLGLEGIKDPGNLGTIMRTADATGVVGVVLIGQTCDPWSPDMIRATMGSFARIKMIPCRLADFVAWRETWQGQVIGTHVSAKTIDYREAQYKKPALILLGSEKDGLSDDILTCCNTLVKIPMAPTVESLNLAIATGVILYEAIRT